MLLCSCRSAAFWPCSLTHRPHVTCLLMTGGMLLLSLVSRGLSLNHAHVLLALGSPQQCRPSLALCWTFSAPCLPRTALGSLGSWTLVLGVFGLGLHPPRPSQGSLSTVLYGQRPGLGCGTCTLEAVGGRHTGPLRDFDCLCSHTSCWFLPHRASPGMTSP